MSIYILLVKNKMKIMLKDKIIWGLLIITITTLILTLRILAANINERSSIPVGIIDYDNSSLSKEFIYNISLNETFYLYEKSKNELENLLQDELLRLIFIIPKGFEEKILLGETQNLIQVKHLKNSKSYNILSDIAAGELIYPVCISKSYTEYKLLCEEANITDILSQKEYFTKALNIKDLDWFDFRFDTQYIDPIENISDNEADNSLLYKYVIGCILTGFMSFLVLFLVNTIIKDRELKITHRLNSIITDRKTVVLSNLTIFLIIGFVCNLLISIVLFYTLNIDSIFRMIYMFFYNEMFMLIIALCFLIITYWIKTMANLQIIGTIVIFLLTLTNIIGFVLELVYNKILIFSKITPNYWYILGFTDIIAVEKTLQETKGNLLILFIILLITFGTYLVISNSRYKNIDI